ARLRCPMIALMTRPVIISVLVYDSKKKLLTFAKPGPNCPSARSIYQTEIALIAAIAAATTRCSNLIAAHRTKGKVIKTSGSTPADTRFLKMNTVTETMEMANAAPSSDLLVFQVGKGRRRQLKISGATLI